MHRISRDNSALYLTSVAKDRLPVFRTEALALLACAALHEARTSGGFSLYAYVVMPDHLHAITDSILKPSTVLQYINGIISRRVIDHLKAGGHNASLRKLRRESGSRGHKYYIHQNPVKAEFVERAEDYRWSSARIWKRCALEDEPLLVNIGQIAWRQR